MKLFLQIELIPWQQAGFDKPLVNYAAGLSDDLIGAELDNQSDSSIADLVIRLCDQVQLILVLIQAQPEQPLGVALPLIQHLLRREEKIYRIILAGQHVSVERLLMPFHNKCLMVTDTDKMKEVIREFAQLNPDR